jgi:hypothetical protein
LKSLFVGEELGDCSRVAAGKSMARQLPDLRHVNEVRNYRLMFCKETPDLLYSGRFSDQHRIFGAEGFRGATLHALIFASPKSRTLE